MKVYLFPMISLSKYVVKLGWSSVNPVVVLVIFLACLRDTVNHTFDAQVSAHERFAHIDMFNLHFNFVLLTV